MANKKEQKPISGLVRTLLMMALNFIEKKFIGKIPLEEVKEGTRLLLEPLQSMINALSDADPENAEQIRAIWKSFLNSDFADFSQKTLSELLAKIENEHIREPLRVLSTQLIAILQIATDDNPANQQQIKELWAGFIRNPQTHTVVLVHLLRPMLESIVKDAEWIEFVVELITTALESGLQNGETKIENAAAVIAKLTPGE